jgi:hypothetical protein
VKLLCSIDWKLFVAILSLFISLFLSISTIISTKNNAQKARLVDVITSNRMEWISKFKELFSDYLSKVSFYYDKPLPSSESEFMTDLYELTYKIKLHLNYKGNPDTKIFSILDRINSAYEILFLYKSCKDSEKEDQWFLVFIGKMQERYPIFFNPFFSDFCTQIGISHNDSDSDIDKNFSSMEPQEKAKSYLKLISFTDDLAKKKARELELLFPELQLYCQLYLKCEWERVKNEAKSGNLEQRQFDKDFLKLETERDSEIQKIEKQING